MAGRDLGGDLARSVRVVIEVEKGARVKVVLDHEKGFFYVKDFLLSPAPFPFCYGFFPQTLGTDGDPLDLILLSGYALPAMSVVMVRLLGGVELWYPEKGIEAKLIGVPAADPTFERCETLEGSLEGSMGEIREFYESYRTTGKRDLRVKGFLDKADALNSLVEAMARYRDQREAKPQTVI